MYNNVCIYTYIYIHIHTYKPPIRRIPSIICNSMTRKKKKKTGDICSISWVFNVYICTQHDFTDHGNMMTVIGGGIP